MAFNQNIPQPTDKLSNSQVQFLANNLALDASFGVDHTTFSNATATNGFHTVIHQISQGVNPATGISNVVYSKNYQPTYSGGPGPVDTQLFSQTFTGTVSQLTGHTAATEGWQWIGGVLLQWGRVVQSIPSNTFSGTVTFVTRGANCIAFPTTCFVVIPTGLYTSPTPLSEIGIAIKSSTLSATKFDWATNTDSSQYTGFNWIAIGN